MPEVDIRVKRRQKHRRNFYMIHSTEGESGKDIGTADPKVIAHELKSCLEKGYIVNLSIEDGKCDKTLKPLPITELMQMGIGFRYRNSPKEVTLNEYLRDILKRSSLLSQGTEIKGTFDEYRGTFECLST